MRCAVGLGWHEAEWGPPSCPARAAAIHEKHVVRLGEGGHAAHLMSGAIGPHRLELLWQPPPTVSRPACCCMCAGPIHLAPDRLFLLPLLLLQDGNLLAEFVPCPGADFAHAA